MRNYWRYGVRLSIRQRYVGVVSVHEKHERNVGWVERSETHHLQGFNGFRYRSIHPTLAHLTG
jgi:hypothetical protein